MLYLEGPENQLLHYVVEHDSTAIVKQRYVKHAYKSLPILRAKYCILFVNKETFATHFTLE